MNKILHTAVCLTVGFSIGLSLSNEGLSLSNEVSITETKTHDGEIVNSQIEFYDNMIQDVDTIEIYDSSEMTEEILTNRDGKIIVEKVIGEVTSYKLDGTILNASTDNGTYISYERVDGVQQGDTILTYYIYNPFTNVQDDVLTRLDFIIDNNEI